MNSRQRGAPVIEVSEDDFQAEVLKSKEPVLVAFWAAWSRPCQVIGAILEEVAADCGGRVRVVKVNADDCLDLSIWYEVQSVPSLLFFVEGDVSARMVGTASKEAILGKLRAVLDGGNAEPAGIKPG